jgi:hypothetical protein
MNMKGKITSSYLLILLALCCMVLLWSSCKREQTPGSDCQKEYRVKMTSRPPVVDGEIGPSEWADAVELADFTLHWETVPTPATSFKSVTDGENLYFSYSVTDNDLVLWEEVSDEMDVVMEDRVELFFAPDRSLKTYYCFEIDPLGRALDNSGSLGQKIDPDWDCPGAVFKGTVRENGYVLEGLIPLKSLQDIGVYTPGKIMLTGLYRAEFNNTGDPKAPDMHWISWIKPDSGTPNFHIPSSFGCWTVDGGRGTGDGRRWTVDGRRETGDGG